MRLYNGMNSALSIELIPGQKLDLSPKSVSGDFLANTEFLVKLMMSYDYHEVSLIAGGPHDINMCAQVSGCVGYVCQTLEEAIEKHADPSDKKAEAVKEEEKTEETETNKIVVVSPDPEEDKVEEPKVETEEPKQTPAPVAKKKK